MVLDLPGLRASAMYPWQIVRQPDPQWEPKYEGEPQRFLEYYYNVENQRTRWEYPLNVDNNGVPRDDLQGAVWERKLALLQQLGVPSPGIKVE